MSRVIKFRAWNSYDKEMIYDVEHTYDFLCSGYGAHEESFGVVLDKEDYVVMQFTGLYDKNDTKIYEGDVVEFVWSDPVGESHFDVQTVEMINYSLMTTLQFADEVEIIGNIYETPELLGE